MNTHQSPSLVQVQSLALQAQGDLEAAALFEQQMGVAPQAFVQMAEKEQALHLQQPNLGVHVGAQKHLHSAEPQRKPLASLEDSRRFDAAIKAHKKREALRILHEVMGVKLVDSSFSRGKGMHDSPGVEDGAPMFDVARGVYPEDLYRGHSQEYGTGARMDGDAFACIFDSEARPNNFVTVYRSVEKDGPRKIQPGDWVTPSRAYAKEHAQSNITGPSKILKERVRACELFTDGNSILEWGYHPQPKSLPIVREGFTLQECINGRLFEQNKLYPKLNDEQKTRLSASAAFQKSLTVGYAMSSLFLDRDSETQVATLVNATGLLKSLRDTGQFGDVFLALDPESKAVDFWRVRDSDRQRHVDAGLNLVEVGDGQYFFAQLQPSLAQERGIAELYAALNPVTANKRIREALPEAREFPVYNQTEVIAAQKLKEADSSQWVNTEILEQFYLDEPVSEGNILAHGWVINEDSDGMEFYRQLGGRGTPFVTFDLTVRHSESDGRWVPIHGSVAMPSQETSAEAANLLMNYWRNLSLRDRLTQGNYKALMAKEISAEMVENSPSKSM